MLSDTPPIRLRDYELLHVDNETTNLPEGTVFRFARSTWRRIRTNNGLENLNRVRFAGNLPGSSVSFQTPGRSYVQLHVVHAASDPELHGVIDVDGSQLLSFWEEGA